MTVMKRGVWEFEPMDKPDTIWTFEKYGSGKRTAFKYRSGGLRRVKAIQRVGLEDWCLKKDCTTLRSKLGFE